MTRTDRDTAPEPENRLDGNGWENPPGILHGAMESLAAIRNYAAAARRALANGSPGHVDFALLKIDEQVCRAHDILNDIRRNRGVDPEK